MSARPSFIGHPEPRSAGRGACFWKNRFLASQAAQRTAGPIFYFLISVFAFALLLWADTIGDLRPTADGGSEQWTNNAGTACSSATCYTEVDEDVVSGCAGTDSTRNKSGTSNGQIQRYDLDESSIPNGATVTQATVQGCLIRGGTQNANFRFNFAINGTQTNCASTSTSTSTLTLFSCTIDFTDDTKDVSDDYEIGVENTQPRDVHLENIEAQVTYTPPGQPPLRRRLIVHLRPSPSSIHPAR